MELNRKQQFGLRHYKNKNTLSTCHCLFNLPTNPSIHVIYQSIEVFAFLVCYTAYAGSSLSTDRLSQKVGNQTVFFEA